MNKVEEYKQRTIQQNKALHLYFQLVADCLNEAGLDIKKVLAENPIDIPWSKEAVKEFLWRPVQKIHLNKPSTTELSTKDIDIIFDTINRFLAGYGIHEDFPSIESIMEKLREKESILT